MVCPYIVDHEALNSRIWKAVVDVEGQILAGTRRIIRRTTVLGDAAGATFGVIVQGMVVPIDARV